MNPAIGKMDRLQCSGRERQLLHAGVSGFNPPAGVHGAGQIFEKHDFCFALLSPGKSFCGSAQKAMLGRGRKKVTGLDCNSPKLLAAGC